MKGMYLVNYFVKGIKSLDQQISLSFYKKNYSIRSRYAKL